MQIEFSPQRSDTHFNYNFNGDIVEVTDLDGVVLETYDFTDVPEGEIGPEEIEQGALPRSCVFKASKTPAGLMVTLVLTHPQEAPEEMRFPINPYDEAAALTLLEARNTALVEPIDAGP